MRYLIFVLVTFLVGCSSLPRGISRDSAGRYTVSSPDGKIAICASAGGALMYNVSLDHQPILNDSRLTISFADNSEIGRDCTITAASGTVHDSTWINRFGKQKIVRDHYNELRLKLHETSGKDFEVIFRAYDDGVAFRYVFPKDFGDFTITQENSQFAFTGDHTCFAGQQPPGFKGPQEWTFDKHTLSYLKPQSVIGLPLLINADRAWIALGESDILNYSGMWLCGDGQSTLCSKLAPRPDGQGCVVASAPHQTPWRVLMIGREPRKLLESNIIASLATPSQLVHTSWVKPGMMAWDHWWSGDVQMDTATIKQYIQLAHDMGWQYQLIDWQWYGPFNKPTSDITRVTPKVDMDEVRRFAREKNVKLWLWMYWTDVDRNDAWKKAFPLYEKWGMAGIKIDFMDRDDQQMVQWYEKITRAAAEHHLMVDFHGSFKTAGFNRTFPNQIVREGILGNEYNRHFLLVTPQHKLMLPFTRLLEGPADFTPGGFRNRQPSQFNPHARPTEVQGTRGQELALYVVYDSPLCCNCDSPEDYDHQPGVDFLKIVPTVWDETRAIEGQPGEYLTVAKRSGKDWYIGSMTVNPRDVELKFDFLPKGNYRLKIWRDAEDADKNAEHLIIEERDVHSGETIKIREAMSGGFVAKLEERQP